MSSFGAYDVNIAQCQIDYLVSSFNKCIQGVPGLAFSIVNLAVFKHTEGNSRSLSLDLHDQWKKMEKTKQFRFTPGTHVIAAFAEALRELSNRGGV